MGLAKVPKILVTLDGHDGFFPSRWSYMIIKAI